MEQKKSRIIVGNQSTYVWRVTNTKSSNKYDKINWLCAKFVLMLALTLRTAPNGPKSCHSIASSVSGGRLYTKIHHPVPTTLPQGVELASAASCTGEVLVPANYISLLANPFPHFKLLFDRIFVRNLYHLNFIFLHKPWNIFKMKFRVRFKLNFTSSCSHL